MCVACVNFADTSLSDDVGLSRDDLKFMNVVNDSAMQCKDGHYQTAPFEESILEDAGK